MAHSRQALKRAKQNEKHRLNNMSQKSSLYTAIKKVLSLTRAGKKEAAKEALGMAISRIDRLSGRKLIHSNKAARLKSRLNKKVKALA